MAQESRILLVDDHAIMRSGLRALLSAEPGFSVVGEAATGKDAIELVRRLLPDVVVMDVRMPDLNGIDATRQALAMHPPVKVIGLSADSNGHMAVEMLRAGALGFVRKDAAYEELIGAIRAALADRIYCNSAVIARFNAERLQASAGQSPSAFNLLSPREREHLQLIADGKSTKEIARHLHVSVKTVETHRRNLMLKLHVHSIAELTKYAIREGLTTP
ncbi:MAG TPA: response regulator transcription factor [Phycisphaerae bacterium]|nr:response regulator transcription factor [Phycisphaerae bacterium]